MRTSAQTSHPRYATATTAAQSSAKLLAANEPAPLFELDDGAVPLLVVLLELLELPELEVEVALAADAEEAESFEAIEAEELRVAMLIVAFLPIAVPVAADPLAPVPIGAVPTSMVVVALVDAVVVLLLLEPPPTTPPEAGFVGTDKVAELDPEAVDEARAETALVGPDVEPPVSVIMPV